MIPDKLIRIDKMPYTKNGKIDRKFLLKIDQNTKPITYISREELHDMLSSQGINLEQNDYIEMRDEEDTIKQILALEKPDDNKFRCYLVGGTYFLIQCAEILLQSGHRIYGIISYDNQVYKWTKDNDIIFIPAKKDYLFKFLSLRKFDYLFSIVNFLDNSFTDIDEIENYLQLSVAGAIPKLNYLSKSRKKIVLYFAIPTILIGLALYIFIR